MDVDKNHIAIGLMLLGLTVGFLAVRYFRAAPRRRLGFMGWLGLGIILGAEILLASRTPAVMLYFTPIVWTGYLLLVHALVRSLDIPSSTNLRNPQDVQPDLKWLALWSVPLWLIFEAYNLRLQNWTYVGLPISPLAAGIGYIWAFSTIWPAIFLTADLLRALGLFSSPAAPRRRWKRSTLMVIFLGGLAYLLVPVLVPVRAGSYLFGFVWIGFALLLDPLNYLWEGRSLLGEWEAGERSTLVRFLAAGWVCGILWEFWNYWAGAKWLYVFPIMQNWKIFEMPMLGYVGFLPFAVECFAMYEFVLVVGRKLGVSSKVVDECRASGSRFEVPDAGGEGPPDA